MAFTQGAPLPDITKTTTKEVTAPGYYDDYLSGLASAGETALSKTGEELIAGYDPLQDTGYGMLPGAATAYQPGLTAAGQTAATAAGGIDATRIAELMDPYRQNVVDEMARLSAQNVQRNLLPQLKAGFVGSGGLGSQRYAGALGQSLADVQSSLTGQQYGALSKGYQDALRASLDELNLQNQAARTQADIAAQEQALGIAGAGALTKAGAERQAYEQSILDAPLKTASNASKLLSGYQIPLSSEEVFVGPEAGAYQTSDLANLAGILSILGSGAAGTAYDRLIGAVSGIGKKLAPDIDWDSLASSNVSLVENNALPGEEGYGWSYYDNGTAISPDGEYYFNGELIWSPGDD